MKLINAMKAVNNMQEPIDAQSDVDQKIKMIDARLDQMADLHFHSFASPVQNEIDIQELWRVIWSGRLFISVVMAVVALGFIFFALSLPNIYRSQALMAPSDAAQGGGYRD